eukprot:1263238-Prymnesium_polylepis.1
MSVVDHPACVSSLSGACDGYFWCVHAMLTPKAVARSVGVRQVRDPGAGAGNEGDGEGRVDGRLVQPEPGADLDLPAAAARVPGHHWASPE